VARISSFTPQFLAEAVRLAAEWGPPVRMWISVRRVVDRIGMSGAGLLIAVAMLTAVVFPRDTAMADRTPRTGRPGVDRFRTVWVD
jgi:hypothetical protein